MPPTSPALAIKLHLLQTGSTITELADAIGTARSHLSQVVNGHLESPRLRRAIASELGMSYQELWGVEDPGVDRLPPGRRKCLTLVNQSGEPDEGAEVADAG